MAMKYTVVIGKAPNNYAAFSPDIPGVRIRCGYSRRDEADDSRGH